MNIFKKITNYFTKFEIILWIVSVILITASFLTFNRGNYLTLVTSLIGVSSLILLAKGNPIGQILIISFSTMYGIISFSYRYYGEVATYCGMSLPMAILSLVTWLRNPSKESKAEVKINEIKVKEFIFMFLLALVVTAGFYFVLKHWGTANLIPSTVSVYTSFCAAYLTMRRSPYYALLYACNDVVLIVLWTLASIQNPAYISVIVCFAVFLVNDSYGFISWRRRQKTQI